MINKKIISRWIVSGVFQPRFGVFCQSEIRTLTPRAVTLVHPKRFFGNKVQRVWHTLRKTLRLVISVLFGRVCACVCVCVCVCVCARYLPDTPSSCNRPNPRAIVEGLCHRPKLWSQKSRGARKKVVQSTKANAIASFIKVRAIAKRPWNQTFSTVARKRRLNGLSVS